MMDPPTGKAHQINGVEMAKTQLNDLAVFGGAPAFAEPLHVGRPNVGDAERFIERIRDVFERRWLTNNGRYVQEFEARVAALTGAKHCVAMCNATVALEIAIRALGLHGEVIVPSMTFVATAHALQWQEITPVFCDIDPATHCISPAEVERLITPRTTGIIGVHLWGRPCDTEALEVIAARRNLAVLYDAAHAFGCSHGGRMVGNFGRGEVFSFHSTKICNTFEGGALVTNDDDLAARARLMKNFGFAGYDRVIYIGTNGKMSEASAAMGLTSLEALDSFVRCNQDNYRRYQAGLSGLPGVRLLAFDERERCNYHYVVAEIDESQASLSRDQLVEVLWAENVLARRYFFPGCHNMEPYRSFFPHAKLLLPETERLLGRVLCLPTGTALDGAAVDAVCALVRLALSEPAAVSRRLAERRAAEQGAR
jgi:dTDP-4-amino-4,6-dideoxygalactose transaminase